MHIQSRNGLLYTSCKLLNYYICDLLIIYVTILLLYLCTGHINYYICDLVIISFSKYMYPLLKGDLVIISDPPFKSGYIYFDCLLACVTMTLT